MSGPSFSVGDRTIVSQDYNGWAAGEAVVVVGVEFKETKDAYKCRSSSRYERIRIRQDQPVPSFEFEVAPEDLLPTKETE